MKKSTLLFFILSLAVSFSFGQSNVLVIDYANAFSSDLSNNNSIIYNRLLTTQTSVTRINSIPASINASQYDQIWIFGNMGFPTPSTLSPIINYMNNGGAVYVQSEISCCNNQAAFVDQLIDSTVTVGGSISHNTFKTGYFEYDATAFLVCTPLSSHGVAVRPFIGTPTKNILFEANSTCGGTVLAGDVVGVRFSSCDMISGRGGLISNGDFNIFPLSGTCNTVGLLGSPNNDSIIDLIADLLPKLSCDSNSNPGGTLVLTATPQNFCGSTQLGWYFTPPGGGGCGPIGCNSDTSYKWSVVSGEAINVPVNFSCDTCPYPIASPSIITTYMLTITFGDTALSCGGSIGSQIPITVYPQPLPTKGTISYVADCENNIDLIITGAYNSLQWQSSINSSPYVNIAGEDSTHLSQSNISAGTCFRVIISTACGTIYSDTICPTLITSPVAAFSISPANQAQIGATVSFTDNSIGNIIAWYWTFGDGNNSNIQNPIHVYQAQGVYTTTLVVTDLNGCMDTTTLSYVIVSDSMSINSIIVPNVFTPNSDGENDFLVFKNLELFDNSLKVFNRWGTLIYEEENYKNTWYGDGISEGTYFYILEVVIDSRPETYKGTVSVLR